jgi:hypothetical protein
LKTEHFLLGCYSVHSILNIYFRLLPPLSFAGCISWVAVGHGVVAMLGDEETTKTQVPPVRAVV